ncbi:MAG: SRPBCC family protein [Saprospiraceae bacterium]
MKYTCEIEIDLPIEKVISLFDNSDNLLKWMEGLQSFEIISGNPGQVGAKARLIFLMGKRKMEMIETITVRNLPTEFSGTYEANGVFNIVKNSFKEMGPNRTKYISEQEFQFKGFMKVIGFIMPGAFKKQSMKYLKAFKNFAESQIV